MNHSTLLRFFLLAFLLGKQLFSPLLAVPATALGYEPKYPADFTHFDYANPDAPKGGGLIIPGMGNFDSLNPFLLRGVKADGITDFMFDTLMVKSWDEPFSVYGLLAEDIELAQDKLSVTFRLNPKARFSDGSEVTAEDVKFSFDTLKSDLAHPQYRIYWADVQKAEVVDKRTVRFNFSKINPELYLIISDLPVFSKNGVGKRRFDEISAEPLLASGAYLVDNYQAGKYITYKRNPDYWAKDLNTRRGFYNFDRITVKYYQDSDVALEALKAGEFDFMAVYNSKEWAREYVGSKFDSGEILKTELPHQNNAGMQGFVFNLRRPIFQDRRVRQAINLAFDFEWANENLFYNQYKRCNSYFSNSELAAPKALPEGDELALLNTIKEKLPKQFPDQVLTEVWNPVSTQAPHSLRDNLRKAQQLLKEAGWTLTDGVLRNAKGESLQFETLLVQKGFERILEPFARNLKKLGIILNYRTVDIALYQRHSDTFDFDITVTIFPQSQSPGNELMAMWHSSSANQEGSNNLIGLKDPVVDLLIEKVIYAENRQKLITAVHALDRIMQQGEYVVPNWYVNTHRIAYWNKFGMPKSYPLYYQANNWVTLWWMK